MNKIFLTIGIIAFASIVVSAQTWNSNNEPEEGANSTMFLVDTTSTNYSTLTGENQIWDYSMLGAYSDSTRIVSVSNADLYVDIFPDASHVSSIPGFMNMAYVYDGVSGDKIAHGYEFELPDLGVAQFILNDFQKVLQFPMAFGATFDDAFSGTLVLLDEPNDAEGTSRVSADATGTLLLANDISHSEVLRMHTLDTIYSEINLTGIPIPIAATIVREQFDYLKPGTSNFPLFTHATLTVLNPLIGEIKIAVVLSTENPAFFVNLPEYNVETTRIFPNPTEAIFQLQLPTENENAQILITDLSGRVIYQNDAYANNQSIDLKTQPAGIYVVNIQQLGTSSRTKIIKK